MRQHAHVAVTVSELCLAVAEMPVVQVLSLSFSEGRTFLHALPTHAFVPRFIEEYAGSKSKMLQLISMIRQLTGKGEAGAATGALLELRCVASCLLRVALSLCASAAPLCCSAFAHPHPSATIALSVLPR
jgi:hypothetical protein